MRKNAHMPLPPGAREFASRRSSSQKVRFINVALDNSNLNVEALVRKGKASAAFGNIDWDDCSWDVTESERGKIRSHKQRRARLHFTQHREADVPKGGGHVGTPFDNTHDFSDVVKSLVRCRRELSGQNYVNQSEIIRAFRYLYDALELFSHDLRSATRAHFEQAAMTISRTESPISAYKQIERLEEVARLLDENGIVSFRLEWRCSHKSRPVMPGERRVLTGSSQSSPSKLPDDEVLEAVGHLYTAIPHDHMMDRIRIDLVTLILLTGLRIGEILTLPAKPVQTDSENGARYLIYYPEKGSPPQKKMLMTIAGDIAEEAVAELLDLTAPARTVAGWLHNNPGKVWLRNAETISSSLSLDEVATQLGFAANSSRNQTTAFLKARGIHTSASKDARISTDELTSALAQDRFDDPVLVVKKSGETLHLKDALCCVFLNALHPQRVTLQYVARPIGEQQISDFLGGKADRKSIFRRYGLTTSMGDDLSIATHGFRHWLNDKLDRGGLSDAEQARYFGRKNILDCRAYQHASAAERARMVRKDLLEKAILGPVAEVAARLPVDRRAAYLDLRIRTVLIVPGGMCLHDYSSTPCPNHMACKNGCGDFHWSKNDDVQRKELEFEASIVSSAIEQTREEVAIGSWGADSWLQHQEQKLAQIQQCIKDCSSGNVVGTNG